MALVLDSGDGTLGAPVDGLRNVDVAEGLSGGEAVSLSLLLVEGVGVVVDLELGGGEVREVVVAEGGEGVLGHHGVGDLHVFGEDLFALGVLIGSVGLVVQLLVLGPGGVSEGHLDGEGDGDADGGKNGVENLHYDWMMR